MKNSVVSEVKPFPLELPELSLQVVSFIEIGFFILLSFLTYYLARRAVLAMSHTGALEKKTLSYQIIHTCTFLVPIFIFLYGLASVSQHSLFVSLLFFVIFSIVFAFSLVDPARSLFAALLINLRGDLKVGDYITFGTIEGEIESIGAFNILVIAKNGSKNFIPTFKILQKPYEIHSKKAGPSIVITIPADKITKINLERLAYLCAFKRHGSDVRISTLEGQHKLSMEIVNRECRPWVHKYFERHYQ